MDFLEHSQACLFLSLEFYYYVKIFACYVPEKLKKDKGVLLKDVFHGGKPLQSSDSVDYFHKRLTIVSLQINQRIVK